MPGLMTVGHMLIRFELNAGFEAKNDKVIRL